MSIQPGSRYEDAEKNFAVRHFYDAWGHPLLEDQEGGLRFVQSTAEATYLVTTLPLPPLPPVEYYAKGDDGSPGSYVEHFPFIAFKFLNDSTRWWQIAEVNPKIWYPLDLTPGAYLRIPS